MRQPCGYSKAVWPTDRQAWLTTRQPRGRRNAPPATVAPAEAEENIVAAAFGRYTGGCESAYRARRPAALRRTTAYPASCLPPRRVVAPGDAYRMNPKPS